MVPVPMAHGAETEATRYSGREFGPDELALIHEVVESCWGLSRKELAQTICELLGWKRPSGALKAQECREFLERLETAGAVELPERQSRRPVGSRTRVPVTARGERGRDLVGDVGDFTPIAIEGPRWRRMNGATSWSSMTRSLASRRGGRRFC